MAAAEIIFWISAFLVAYTYLGYPGLVALLARLRPKPVRRAFFRPRISLVIVAYNEAGRIERKLRNCIDLVYPRDRMEIIVASDGSADGTVEIARRYARHGVSVIAFDTRRGKPSVLNDVIPRCRGEIVVLSDARQMYDRHALVALVEDFGDPSVGAASGELHLQRDGGAGVGEGIGFYWRYEKFIRRRESRLDSTVGATGAIYAVRRELFEPIAADTVLDDVLIPLRIVRRGYRVIFEPEAMAFDRAAETPGEEFTRKARTIAGNVQLFARERWLWSVRDNRLWLQTFSHKFLRIVAPFLLAGAAGTSVTLAGSSSFFRTAVIVQVAFYAAALAGFLLKGRTSLGPALSVPYAFCLLNVTALVGLVRFFTGSQAITWRKASDPAASQAGFSRR